MCAFAAIGAVAGIASAVVGAQGAAAQAEGQAQQAEAQARTAQYNATVAKINARTARDEGVVEQERIGAKYDRQRGTAIAAAGKAGIDPSYGSAALVIFGENAMNEAADKSMSYANADAKATANINQAKDQDMQAQAYHQSAQTARKAGQYAAMGSFLSGIGGAVKGFSSIPSLKINA